MYKFLLKKREDYKILNFSKGFSLLELLIVLAIIVIISSMGVGFYSNYGKSVEVNSVVKTLTFDLKQVQSKSMSGDSGLYWGIHFENGTSDFYEIFSTSVSPDIFDYSVSGKTIASKNYLSSGVLFSDPTEGLSKNIIFNKISGGTIASTVVLISRNITKTINISNLGNISSQ